MLNLLSLVGGGSGGVSKNTLRTIAPSDSDAVNAEENACNKYVALF